MDALVAKINAFAPKSDAFEAHIAVLDASHAALKQALDASALRWLAHAQAFAHVREQVVAIDTRSKQVEQTLSSLVAPQLCDQSEKLTHIEDTQRRLATKTSSMETTQRVLSAKFQSVAAALAEQLKKQGEMFEVRVSERQSYWLLETVDGEVLSADDLSCAV